MSATQSTPVSHSTSADIYYPQGVPRTIIGAFRHWVRHKPDANFIKFDGSWTSWRQFDEATDSVAAGLHGHGLTPGSRLGYISTTSKPMLQTYFGSAKLGVVQVPVNIFLRGEFLRHQLGHSRVSTVAVDQDGLASVAQVLPKLPDVKQIILLEGTEPPVDVDVPVYRFADVCAGAEPPPDVQIAPTDLFQVMYTSGTTGPSKGCMISNRYMIRVAASCAYAMGVGHEDVRLSTWPLNHISGSGPLAEAVLMGIPLVIEPSLVIDGLVERMAADGVTYFVGLGPVAPMLLDTPSGPADRAHRIRMALLVPCPVDIQAAITERFGFEVSGQLWAQTECNVATATPVGDPGFRPGTSGRPMPDLDIVLLDDSDLPVPVGEVGEICIRPREPGAMFDGYLDDPDATLRAMGTMWFHSGDMGRFDEEGNLTFVDRKKDMMRRSGENVSSFELEATLRAHPVVANAAVHETADVSATTNDIVAWLVLVPGTELDVREFAEYLWENVPYFAVPRFVKIIDELPMTVSNRVQKFELRARELGDDVWDLKALDLLTPRDRRRAESLG